MGTLYEQGLSVDVNHSHAYDCYKKAADLGHVKANTKVGHYYYSGILTDAHQEQHNLRERDSEDVYGAGASTAYAETVSDASVKPECYKVQPDRKLALKRYLKAAKLGDSEACNCVALLIEKDNSIGAVDFYRRALELDDNNSDALFNMALLYFTDKQEEEWHDEAI